MFIMILVTGASGHLASLTIAELRARCAIAAGGSRTPGDGLRRLDFDDPTSLDLAGVSTLVLVSAGYAEDDQVIARHAAVSRLGVTHTTISLGEYRARLLASKELLPFQPPMLASIATIVRHGFLAGTSPELRNLLGRPLTDALTAAADSTASLRPNKPS